MSGKRDKGTGGNPWVNQPGPDADPDEPEEQLPPSPWNLEVQPPPSPWGGSAAPGNGPAGPGGPGPGPATQTSSAWGDKVGPPSLRRPPTEKKRGRLPHVPPLLIPIGAGLLVVVIVAIVLVALSGGGDKTAQNPPSTPVSTPAAPKTSYQPPPNAIQVGFGVSLVPVTGWTLFPNPPDGKQVAIYPPNTKADARAFFWVRQKRDVTANAYLLGIVEGETEEEITQLGAVRNLPCPKDVLVECVAIDYTSSFTKNGAETKVKGSIEAYRRKDGVVTALDFRTNADFAPKAEADAAIMKKSVIDSM